MLQVLTIPALLLLNVPGLTGTVTYPQLPGLSSLSGSHLSVTSIQRPSRIVVTPQLQGGSVSNSQAFQAAFGAKTIQGTSAQIQASETALNRLQPAVGIGADGFTLQ